VRARNHLDTGPVRQPDADAPDVIACLVEHQRDELAIVDATSTPDARAAERAHDGR